MPSNGPAPKLGTVPRSASSSQGSSVFNLFGLLNTSTPNIEWTGPRKQVIIVGLGYAGARLAVKLDESPLSGKAFNVVAIEANTRFWHSLATMRALVNEEYANKFALATDKVLTHEGARMLMGTKVVDVTAGEVVTDKGEAIKYDYLVIATGSTYHGTFIKAPNGVDAALESMAAVRKVIAQPEAKLVIVGAGLIGLEFAGEIKTAFPQTKVTVVDSNSDVLSTYSTYSQSAKDDVRGKLAALGVEFLFNERVVDAAALKDAATVEPRQIKLESGKVLESDAQLFAVGGMKPNSTAFNKGFLGGLLNGEGRIKVNKFLQVEGHDNIFAVGDINDVKVIKAAMRAGSEGENVAANLLTLIKGSAAGTPLNEYKISPAQDIAFVSLNPKAGTGFVRYDN